MVEKRTYAEIVLVILFMTSLGVNITDKDATDNIYSCGVEEINDMYCFKLSKINDDGIQRNCYYNEEAPRKYKVCSLGWEQTTLQEALEKESEISYIVKQFQGNQWLCSPSGCEAIK